METLNSLFKFNNLNSVYYNVVKIISNNVNYNII